MKSPLLWLIVGVSALKLERTEKFGFYFPVHSQIPSTLNVVKSVREFYPTAPLYLLQDGGNVDFGPLRLGDRGSSGCGRLREP